MAGRRIMNRSEDIVVFDTIYVRIKYDFFALLVTLELRFRFTFFVRLKETSVKTARLRLRLGCTFFFALFCLLNGCVLAYQFSVGYRR